MPSQPEDRPGKLLNRKYELIERVGRGGMAVVWRGHTHGAAGFQRVVAIKRMDPGFMNHGEVVQMFVEEARVCAALRHPNIVQIHDFGIDEHGSHYLVTEWVEGLHFGDYLRAFGLAGEKTPWPLVTLAIADTLRALDAAHNRRDAHGQLAQVLHRDVTPPNILLDELGIAKLADFGMARAMDRSRMTRPDIVKGKLSYLAPELLLGDPPSPQSDLFGLGVVMWEALAGERLFDSATDLGVIKLVREARVPLIGMRRPDLPVGLTQLVHRTLERDPGRRPRSAREMLSELTQVLRVLPSPPDSPQFAESIALARKRLLAEPDRAELG